MHAKDVIELVVLIIGVLGGGGGLLALSRIPQERRKLTGEAHNKEAEAVKNISEAASDLVKSFQMQVEDLKLELAEANAKIDRMERSHEKDRLDSQKTLFRLASENEALKDRIRELESKI